MKKYQNGISFLSKRLYNSKFSFKDAEITLAKQLLAKPDYTKEIKFGHYHTDHMLEIDHDVVNGWHKPIISPYHSLSIDPKNSTLHYGIELFEGLKAYKNKDKMYLFRPELNMARMNRSAERIGLPAFDGEDLIKCIEKLIMIDEGWALDKKGFSLYIRPTFISMTDALGVAPPTKSKIFVIVCPVGPYFSAGIKPLRLTCNDDSYLRSFKGGFGEFKLGANYGPTLKRYIEAKTAKFDQILWLVGDNISEAGVMNFFTLIQNDNGDKELITCNLDGTVLPGVTRQSVLDLAKDWGLKTTERQFSIHEFIELHSKKKILEVFCTGTAAVVMPIREITYLDKTLSFMEKDGIGDLCKKILDTITDIQYGEYPHRFQRVVV